MPAIPEFQRRLESIEVVIRQIEAAGDPNVRAAARELVELVMELHGAGLERILEIVRASSESGEFLAGKLGRDDMVASLLVLYGLHPQSVEERVHQALEKANRQMRSRGTVELIDIEDGAVRLEIKSNGQGAELKEVVEAAIYQAAPDIISLVIEGGEEKAGFVPLEMLLGITPTQAARNGRDR
jgi:hypothetical protein